MDETWCQRSTTSTAGLLRARTIEVVRASPVDQRKWPIQTVRFYPFGSWPGQNFGRGPIWSGQIERCDQRPNPSGWVWPILGQSIHCHDLLWPTEDLRNRLFDTCGSKQFIYMILCGHIWPHRPHALKPQPHPHKILDGHKLGPNCQECVACVGSIASHR
jgi:hypothetical protein